MCLCVPQCTRLATLVSGSSVDLSEDSQGTTTHVTGGGRVSGSGFVRTILVVNGWRSRAGLAPVFIVLFVQFVRISGGHRSARRGGGAGGGLPGASPEPAGA